MHPSSHRLSRREREQEARARGPLAASWQPELAPHPAQDPGAGGCVLASSWYTWRRSPPEVSPSLMPCKASAMRKRSALGGQEKRYLLICHVSPRLQWPTGAIVAARGPLALQERLKAQAGPTGPRRAILGRRSARRGSRGRDPGGRGARLDLLAYSSGAIGGLLAASNHSRATTLGIRGLCLRSLGSCQFCGDSFQGPRSLGLLGH